MIRQKKPQGRKGPKAKTGCRTCNLANTSDDERSGIEWFMVNTSAKMPGVFESKFWNLLVLQASWSEPAILHAVLALGAAHKCDALVYNSSSDAQLFGCPEGLQRTLSHHYSRAIALLQPYLAVQSKENLRVALISCIVFACLEFLRQQYQTGNALLQNSFKLLNDMRPQCGGGTILLTPDPTSIDDILVEEIARLDIQATLLGHGSRQRYLVDSQPLLSIQHPDFRTVRVARKQLDALLCVVHALTTMAPPERILPKLAAKGQVESGQGAAAIQRRALPPRRRNAPVACQNCRARKVKCGGARPKCHQCEKALLDCIYDVPAGLNRRQADREQIASLQATVDHLRRRVSTQGTPTSGQSGSVDTALEPSQVGNIRRDVQSSADLVELLRDQPEGFALQVLESLRQGSSPKAIMDSISGNLSGSVTPSIHAAARGTSTPTQTPLEFQLVVQYPKVYPPLAPLNAASLDLQLLGIQPLDAGNTHDAGLSTLFHDNTSSTIRDKIVQPQDVISRASFGADNGIPIDPRLHRVDISHWTTVTISNQFAAEAISLYLNMNQPWWAFFDTDLFLDDLVNVETNFCSRMLVNALLAWATQSYAHYEPMAATLPTKFLDEALRIYDAEKGVDSLTTVAATSLMSMTWTTLGKDKAGRRLQEDSARMAQRMGLYGDSGAFSYHQLDLSDGRVEAAVCATAWGSFNFQMVMSMSYHQEPIPKRTPRFRIPGKTLTAAQHDVPSTDATYTAVCQFWLVVFDMNYLYYFERSVSISSAVAIFQRLLGWADALPAGVGRDEHNPDHVLNIHIWFHTAIIDLFRPFEHEFPQPKLPAFAGVNATPKAVISASIEQLKRLVYQYRAHCESSKYSIIWQSGMLYLVNYILRDLSSNESQFYFLLCMRGYQHLARYMPFVSGIVQSLIVMTNRQGGSLTANTQRLLKEVRDESRRSREFFSAYPVDLEMVARDPFSASLEKLTSRFQEEPWGRASARCLKVELYRTVGKVPLKI
ncbi:hypothetical protein QSH57_011737 [Fusarium oxysporum f. sp. vasinfectum]|nr:hypothetical protein QSH57_011737 [Fusarium oxysporum f. sp. vasinfectum]